MLYSLSLKFFAIAALVTCSSALVLKPRTVSQDVYNDLVYHWKFCGATLKQQTDSLCPYPNGQTRVLRFNDFLTDTNGFVARDDGRQEIIVAFAGTASLQDILVDFSAILVPLVSEGVAPPAGTLVHQGFLRAYNAVAADILDAVSSQLAQHPGYTLSTSGHSLGGALSAIAGVSLKQNFPNVPLKMFTYGEPRVYNSVGALWVNDILGENVFRVVHKNDAAPFLFKSYAGYRHFGIEYWQTPDPSSPGAVKKCAADGEDPTCSLSVESQPSILDHQTYMGLSVNTAFCTQV